MFARLLSFTAAILGMAAGQQHRCASPYDPSDYVGEIRVPTNCKLEVLNCSRSWKSGILRGSETSRPMVDEQFLKCHEGFTLCGYVPLDKKTGEVLGQSGVTVGSGVDFGSKSRDSFKSVSSTLVDKIAPYFGLKKRLAACAAIERPLQLTPKEANNLTTVVINDFVNEVSRKYEKDKTGNNTLAFASLPRSIRTAIVSVWYQFGNPAAYPNFWGFVTKNDWNNAVKKLRKFYSNPDVQQRGDLKRRNDEADIIEAVLGKCNRSVDVVFLLDESGSVGSSNFRKSLNFVKEIIKAFPDDKLSGEDGTRFGLSTFSSRYLSHFHLSNYANQSEYFRAIDDISYSGGGTSLGMALQQILTDQFSEKRGLRPEKDGLPRILIVLTDGRSGDSVSIPAKNVTAENIVVYAIGVAGFNLAQLEEIASSETHVYTLAEFSELQAFISTLTSSTCYESRPAPLYVTITANVMKNEFQYFTYKVDTSKNLEIKVRDTSGDTKIYVSRTNPHPYKYDNDLAFDVATQKNKILVISPKGDISTRLKRSAGNVTKEIYVSVTSDTDSASFEIEANECDPLNCTEGTNEILPTPTPSSTRRTIRATTNTSSERISWARKHLMVIISILMILFDPQTL